MGTRLIRLDDGTLVEVEIDDTEAREISGILAKRVQSSFTKVVPVLEAASKPIKDVWASLNADFAVSEAQLEIGVSFTAEGDVYVVKSKADASLKVTFKLHPRDS